MNRTLLLGTRGSLLATTQSQWVADHISGVKVDLTIIKTAGDDLTISLTSPAQPGAFVNALRSELLAGKVDFIVHSFKDLPSHPHPELELIAIPTREDPRDVLISQDNLSLTDLAAGSVIGTSSPRRQSAITQINPTVSTSPIRGNIDSRIKKVRDGEYSAIILAAAGVHRINRENEISHYLPIEQFIPAPAQGALAVECRNDDDVIAQLLKPLDNPVSRITTAAERAVLVGLNAGCDLPVGAFAQFTDGELKLIAELGDHNGKPSRRISQSIQIDSLEEIQSAYNLGLHVAQQLHI
jgi:hydroxymethylbilane synthase